MVFSEQFKAALQKEFSFMATRSSGPGGQNVNKVSSRIEVRFNVYQSKVLSSEQKFLLCQRLANKLTSDFELIITSQEDRSQLINKQLAMDKLFTLLAWALTPPKKRKHTHPTKSSVEKRLTLKKRHAQVKAFRRLPNID